MHWLQPSKEIPSLWPLGSWHGYFSQLFEDLVDANMIVFVMIIFITGLP